MKYLSLAMFALFLSAGAAGAQNGPPQAAIDACVKHANAYNGVASGAQFSGDAQADVAWFSGAAGDNWRLRIDASPVAVFCTVSADGKRVAIEPAS
jgi:hypothetical protein